MSEIRENLKSILVSLIDGMDAGNTNLTDDEMVFLTDTLRAFTDDKISKYQAARYLGLNEKQFDYKVSKGEIPPGRKQIGFKEKFWYRSDLEHLIRHK